MNGLFGTRMEAVVIAATNKALCRDRARVEKLGAIFMAGEDETDLNGRVVASFGIKIVSDIHGFGGFGTSRGTARRRRRLGRRARAFLRGIRVVGGHDLSEPNETHSRGFSNAVNGFAVGDNGGISNATQQLLTKR